MSVKKDCNTASILLRVQVIFLLLFLCLYTPACAEEAGSHGKDIFAPFRKQLEPGNGALPAAASSPVNVDSSLSIENIPLKPAKECDPNLRRPSYPIFRGLKHVVFLLRMSGESLDSNYKSLPTPLHPDHLTNLMLERLQGTIMPQVQRRDDCKISKPINIKNGKLSSIMNRNDTLTVVLKLSSSDMASPRVFTLGIDYYRPNFTTNSIGYSTTLLFEQISIPSTLSEEKIANELKGFVDGLWDENIFYADFLKP
jgi:hypothetical protein